jgi:hypothetical protein
VLRLWLYFPETAVFPHGVPERLPVRVGPLKISNSKN